jgi:hypothetical protein
VFAGPAYENTFSLEPEALSLSLDRVAFFEYFAFVLEQGRSIASLTINHGQCADD